MERRTCVRRADCGALYVIFGVSRGAAGVGSLFSLKYLSLDTHDSVDGASWLSRHGGHASTQTAHGTHRPPAPRRARPRVHTWDLAPVLTTQVTQNSLGNKIHHDPPRSRTAEPHLFFALSHAQKWYQRFQACVPALTIFGSRCHPRPVAGTSSLSA